MFVWVNSKISPTGGNRVRTHHHGDWDGLGISISDRCGEGFSIWVCIGNRGWFEGCVRFFQRWGLGRHSLPMNLRYFCPYLIPFGMSRGVIHVHIKQVTSADINFGVRCFQRPYIVISHTSYCNIFVRNFD